jgi:serine/threonine-protein kinase
MELLGRYQPLFVIGRGGMGTIEVAAETQGGAVVALKRMNPGVRDRRHADMFLREARLATLLNHENVVHAFAFGEQDGELLIAMEYLEGETLASLLQVAKLPLDVATYILADLCEGLHAAHELKDVTGAPLGVVHRDVSPQNVMLSYTGQVKVLDFGVAKLESHQLTKTGEVKGKTAYMSPEQAMSDAVDRRSDLYGIGAILFELVTGKRMWKGETDLEHIRQLALAEPPKLSEAAPDAPKALHELHAKLVAKKPADRPETAAEVARVLRTLHVRQDARRSLERLLREHYEREARAKKQKLEAALANFHSGGRAPAHPHLRSPAANDGLAMTGTPTRSTPSRLAPWMIAAASAAIASAAVFAMSRNRTGPAAQTTVPATVTVTVTASAPEVAPTNANANVQSQGASPSLTVGRTQRPRMSAPPRATATTAPPPTTTSSAPARPAIDVDPKAI